MVSEVLNENYHTFKTACKLGILGFHCHAIEKKNRNHSMNEVKKLTWYRG